MHKKEYIAAGRDVKTASQVLIMVHGRGGTAEDIISLSDHLNVKDFALLAPQATNNTWYPYSFLTPTSQNEPWLGAALNLLKEIVDDLEEKGISKDNIYFLGFSQALLFWLDY